MCVCCAYMCVCVKCVCVSVSYYQLFIFLFIPPHPYPHPIRKFGEGGLYWNQCICLAFCPSVCMFWDLECPPQEHQVEGLHSAFQCFSKDPVFHLGRIVAVMMVPMQSWGALTPVCVLSGVHFSSASLHLLCVIVLKWLKLLSWLFCRHTLLWLCDNSVKFKKSSYCVLYEQILFFHDCLICK